MRHSSVFIFCGDAWRAVKDSSTSDNAEIRFFMVSGSCLSGRSQNRPVRTPTVTVTELRRKVKRDFAGSTFTLAASLCRTGDWHHNATRKPSGGVGAGDGDLPWSVACTIRYERRAD